MNTSNESTLIARRFFKRAAAMALLAGLAVTAGVTAIAHGAGGAGMHHAGPMSAADVDSHVDRMLQHLYVEIDVTDAQKAQIEPLVKQAVAECAPLHERFHTAHADILALLGADRIDRDAIETLRSIVKRGIAAGVMRKDLDPIDLHMSISALCFFNVSNRHTFSTIFKVDMVSLAATAARRESVTDLILRFVAP